ncbi:hypothetical protein X943_000500 [Babesia divergens]|uniref:Ribosome recycling factor domain-containing protein n=1 Tax=Babesia divergens TaxID=32595 RepID=A0AAD9GJ83_BABDI|nr:hypothetical protein X943_000500 [Babesia divergens]
MIVASVVSPLLEANCIALRQSYIAIPRECLFISQLNRPSSPTVHALHASKKSKDRRRKGKNSADDESEFEDNDTPEGGVSEADLEAVFTSLGEKLKESEEFLRNKIGRLALHRATPSLLESITVELPGEAKEKQLQYVARIMSRGNYELHVVPIVSGNLDAIFCSLSTKLVDYKVTMMSDRVSVVIPSMTDTMVSHARTIVKETLNEVKSQIRITRQNTLKKLKKMHDRLSDDMFFRQQKEVDKVVKESEKSVDKIANDTLQSLN